MVVINKAAPKSMHQNCRAVLLKKRSKYPRQTAEHLSGFPVGYIGEGVLPI